MIQSESYFASLVAATPTRVWVNNPTVVEIGLALERAAVGCTTNPTYAAGLLKRAPEDIIPIVDACLRLSLDDRVVAEMVQQRLVARLAAILRPLHEETAGRWGYVSIQGSPETDADGERIWEEVQAGHALGPNVAPKIPATLPGLMAFERAVARGWPVIVTEVFSLDQLVSCCERYLKATESSGNRPRFFVSPITGIFGDHLKKVAQQLGLDLPQRTMELAGIYLARKCEALAEQRAFPVTLLFGGARIREDLTGLVGGPTCTTINWSTFAEILDAEPPVEETITQPPDPHVERELCSAFPDVQRAWNLGSISPEEFESFGPVQHFRSAFLSGWQSLLSTIAERRLAEVAATR